ncbi:hypothetical protein niasHT_038395 [Heterodera trifolii]|uniref:Uncharacterized protein n=1 Tax=Heterodera trifolii TaxID=157864 RepID=A0ABD2HPK5_9BILA
MYLLIVKIIILILFIHPYPTVPVRVRCEPPPAAVAASTFSNPTSSSKAAAADEIEREKKEEKAARQPPCQTTRVKKGGVPAKVVPRHPDPDASDDEYVVKSVLAFCEVKSRVVKSKCYYIDWVDARGQESWILSTCNDALEITGEHLEDSALDAAYDAVYGEPVADHLARKIFVAEWPKLMLHRFFVSTLLFTQMSHHTGPI